MQSFFEWFENHVPAENPWLMLGKGPSFERRNRHALASYRLLGLNHVVRQEPVLVAHMIDADVVDACGDALLRNAGILVMPWYPHQHNQPGGCTLAELAAANPVLARFDAEGRLLWYDLSTAPIRRGTAPVVEATYFSAEAALNLLALAGARTIRTLGVDGGAAYSPDFDDLRGKTLLANGRPSFDLQFEGFARTILRTGITFGPLELPCPAKVYVPCAPAEALPVAVLRHSIRRRASISVEVIPVPVESGPIAGGEDALVILAPGTQCFADVRPIWATETKPMEIVVPALQATKLPTVRLALLAQGSEAALGALTSVIHIGAAMDAFPVVLSEHVQFRLPPAWNPSVRYEQGRTSFLWYGGDGRVPWLSRSHPLGHLWSQELLDGVDHGFISAEFVEHEVRCGHVRASLCYQLEHRLVEPLLLPRRARLLDRAFKSADGSAREGSPWRLGPLALARALGREVERRARALRARQRPRPALGGVRVHAGPQGSADFRAAHSVDPQ